MTFVLAENHLLALTDSSSAKIITGMKSVTINCYMRCVPQDSLKAYTMCDKKE